MQEIISLIERWEIRAVIFDLDGTLVDNNEFHLRSWRKYLEDRKIDISEEDYLANINGRTNKDAVEYIYQRKMSDEEAMHYALEKEAVYREMYAPFIKPVAGLLPMLERLHEKNLPMAIATSGIQVNIDFMFEHLGIRRYFKTVVNSAHIKKGKPDPEIYQKTALQLKVEPNNCLVFEDAVVGIRAAHAAGMKVIALTTTHSAEELSQADLLIKDYTDLVGNATLL
ncbi:MAG TPA: HAD family phosphatase [Chitinophagaceae bacterium]